MYRYFLYQIKGSGRFFYLIRIRIILKYRDPVPDSRPCFIFSFTGMYYRYLSQREFHLDYPWSFVRFHFWGSQKFCICLLLVHGKKQRQRKEDEDGRDWGATPYEGKFLKNRTTFLNRIPDYPALQYSSQASVPGGTLSRILHPGSRISCMRLTEIF